MRAALRKKLDKVDPVDALVHKVECLKASARAKVGHPVTEDGKNGMSPRDGCVCHPGHGLEKEKYHALKAWERLMARSNRPARA